MISNYNINKILVIRQINEIPYENILSYTLEYIIESISLNEQCTWSNTYKKFITQEVIIMNNTFPLIQTTTKCILLKWDLVKQNV